MSGSAINSSILLGLGLIVGFSSLAAQTYFWDRRDKGLFSGTLSALKEIFKQVFESLTVWRPNGMNYNSLMFTRISVTAVLMAGLIVVILATYDSVSSFWIYFVLYLGVALLAFPIVMHIVAYLWSRMSKKDSE